MSTAYYQRKIVAYCYYIHIHRGTQHIYAHRCCLIHSNQSSKLRSYHIFHENIFWDRHGFKSLHFLCRFGAIIEISCGLSLLLLFHIKIHLIIVSQLNLENISKILRNWRVYDCKSKYIPQTKCLIKKIGNGSFGYLANVNNVIKKNISF